MCTVLEGAKPDNAALRCHILDRMGGLAAATCEYHNLEAESVSRAIRGLLVH